MQALPDDVTLGLLRALSAYMRATPPQELPPTLRRFRSFRASALLSHAHSILSTLEDERMRLLLKQWLEDQRHVAPADAQLLRIAIERGEDWDEQLRARSRERTPAEQQPGGDGGLREALGREKQKVRRAKDEARKARDEARAALDAERMQAVKLRSEVDELQRLLASARSEAAAATRRVDDADERQEREVRKARRAAERLAAERDEHKRKASELRRELTEAKRRIAELEERLATPRPRTQRVPRSSPAPEPRNRAALAVPKGRLADDPEALEEWLRTPSVHLLVDGYNVTKAQGGFGELELEAQRNLLVEGVTKLARRTKARATIVFDGSEVPAGTSRARRGPVRVEYSTPPDSADDHVVAIVQTLPNHPVVVATNDRELQERVRSRGATVASSEQLLALIRGRSAGLG